MKPISTDEIRRRVEALADLTESRHADATYACHTCLDTGQQTIEQHHRCYPDPVLYSAPCPDCEQGKAIREARRAKEFRANHEPDDEDKARFARVFKRMCLLFGKRATPDLLDAYWDELRHYGSADVERGVRWASRRCKYLPRISDILDGVNGPPF